MEKLKILDIENDGLLNMGIDEQYLYVRCNRFIYKYDLNNMSVVAQNEIFKKDGKARGFSVLHDFVFLWDFLDLYILNKDDLSIIDVLRLGENLSSDVCGVMYFDSPKAYVKIRNGWIYVLDINSKNIDKIQISDSSFWSDCVTETHLFVGTVNGELLEIDRFSLEVIRKIQLCKKNIYSIVHENGLLYTASQDGTIKVVDSKTFETIKIAQKAVVGMVEFVGIYNDELIIAGHRNPLAFWDKKTLQMCKTAEFPYNRSSVISNDTLFVCDSQSVYKVALI